MTDNWIAFLPILGAIFLVLSLAGCAGKSHIETVRPPLNIPPQMYQCDDAGLRPKGTKIMESEVARYIVALESSNKDCKTKLKELAVVISCYNEKDCNVDKLVQYMGLVGDEKKR
jgi:hypothetical protein